MLIREATIEDSLAIAQVRVATWKSTYRGMMPDAILDALDAEKSAEDWRKAIARRTDVGVWVCELSGQGIVGFACAGGNREPLYPADGEVFAIYVLKECQGLGAGRKLMQAAFAWLSGRGFRSCLVQVLKGNPAEKFYAAMGGELQAASTFPEVGGTKLEHAAYLWSPIG